MPSETHAPRRRPSWAGSAALLFAFALVAGCGEGGVRTGSIRGGGNGDRVIKLPTDGAASQGNGGQDGGATGAAGGGAGRTGALVSAECLQCEKTQCTTESFINENGFAFPADNPDDPPNVDLYDLCYPKDPTSKHATDLPIEGPAAGTGVTRAQLCRDVIDCVRRTKCHYVELDFSCYCGTSNATGETPQACVAAGAANGPCKDVFEAAVESQDPITVVGKKLELPQPGSPGNALGYAMTFLLACETAPLNEGEYRGPCIDACLSSGGPFEQPDGGADVAAAEGGGAAGTGGGAGTGAGGGGAGAGGGAGTSSAAGTGGPVSCVTTYAVGPGCEACATTSTQDACSRGLTAAIDPNSGDPVGFGLETLPSQAQRDTAYLLVRRIKTLLPNSARNEDNTANAAPGSKGYFASGLLILGSPPLDLFTGTHLLPPEQSAWNEYRAATFADFAKPPVVPDPAPGINPNGPDPNTRSQGAVAAYISSHAGEPTSALGLANNILQCAFSSGCDDCFNVTSTTVCQGNDGGVDAPAADTSGGAGTGAAGTGAAGTGAAGTGAAGTGAAGTGVAGTGATGTGAAGTGAAGTGAAGAAGGTPLACPDLDHDAVGDCEQTLVRNAAFDTSVVAWAPSTGSTAAWTSFPGNGGALVVTNVDVNPLNAQSGWTSTGVMQCLSLPPGSTGRELSVALRAHIRGGQGGAAAAFVVDSYFSSGCSGSAFPFPLFRSPQVTTTDSWQTIAGTTSQVPIGVLSVGLRLVALKPVAQSQVEVAFDDVLARVR